MSQCDCPTFVTLALAPRIMSFHVDATRLTRCKYTPGPDCIRIYFTSQFRTRKKNATRKKEEIESSMRENKFESGKGRFQILSRMGLVAKWDTLYIGCF